VDERVQTIEELFRRYAGVLYDRCLRILGNRTAAEDAVQETFINAFRAIDSYTPGESGPLPWLYRIATNVCFKDLRRRRQRSEARTALSEDSGTRDVSDPVHAKEVLQRLTAELDQRSIDILVAHYIEGVDQGRIAQSLGISRRAVVKRLTALRARASELLATK
jgi:RNA polymerase sigma-70 factor (ECF subfamily)